MIKKYNFLQKNSLSLVFILLMLISWSGQAITGWKVHNVDLSEDSSDILSFIEYLQCGHFLQATFENWESEFLQMGSYVILTVYLRQIGSSESKPIGAKTFRKKDLKPKKNSPWPVRKGGLSLFIYSHSLSLAFFLLFILSFYLHLVGSLKSFNEHIISQGKTDISKWEYLTYPQFWFESLQNWQSEFLSVASIVLLSIWLREKGSPESKPVNAAFSEEVPD